MSGCMPRLFGACTLTSRSPEIKKVTANASHFTIVYLINYYLN